MIPILAALIKPRHLLYLGTFIVLALGCWYLHFSIDKGGYDRAMAEVAAKQEKADKQLRKIRRESEDDLQNVDRDALIKYFCDTKRVRNPEHCPK